MEDLLKKFITRQSYLSSAFSGQINIGSLNTVSDLHIEKEVLILYVLKELFSLSQVLGCILCNKKNRRNGGDDLQIVEHVFMSLTL